PLYSACFFGVLKAGGIAVGTMPMLRAKELTDIVTKTELSHALCDIALSGETQRAPDTALATRVCNGAGPSAGLEAHTTGKPATFADVDTAADDTAVIAFTS